MKKRIMKVITMFVLLFVLISNAITIDVHALDNGKQLYISNEQELLKALDFANNNKQNQTIITIIKDFEISKTVEIMGGNITLIGKTGTEQISLSSELEEKVSALFFLSGTEYNPCNVIVKNLIIDGNLNTRLFWLEDKFCTLVLNEGGVLKNGSAKGGAAVLLNSANSYAKFVMNDGLITGCVDNSNGSGYGTVLTWGGNIEINGGTIRDNTAAYTGGVASLGGTLQLRGGKIINNHTTSNSGGGGVYVNGGVKAYIGGDFTAINNTRGTGNDNSGDIYLNGTTQCLQLIEAFTGQVGLHRYYPQANESPYIIGANDYQITLDDLSCFKTSTPSHIYYLDKDNNQIMMGTARTITFFDTDGQINTQKVASGISTNLLENSFVRDGYVFMGWNSKEDGSGTIYSNKEEIAFNDDMSLYAQWIKTPTLTISNIQMYDNAALNINTENGEMRNWKSLNSDIINIDSQGKASALLVNKQAMITADMSYNGYLFPVSFKVNTIPRVITFTYEDANLESITYPCSNIREKLSNYMTFAWKDEPKYIVDMIEGKDINFSYSISKENGGNGKEYNYNHLPLLAGNYNKIKINILNPNYIFQLNNGSIGNVIQIDVNVEKIDTPIKGNENIDQINGIDNTNVSNISADSETPNTGDESKTGLTISLTLLILTSIIILFVEIKKHVLNK